MRASLMHDGLGPFEGCRQDGFADRAVAVLPGDDPESCTWCGTSNNRRLHQASWIPLLLAPNLDISPNADNRGRSALAAATERETTGASLVGEEVEELPAEGPPQAPPLDCADTRRRGRLPDAGKPRRLRWLVLVRP